MKKFLMFLSVFVLSLSLFCACDNNRDDGFEVNVGGENTSVYGIEICIKDGNGHNMHANSDNSDYITYELSSETRFMLEVTYKQSGGSNYCMLLAAGVEFEYDGNAVAIEPCSNEKGAPAEFYLSGTEGAESASVKVTAGTYVLELQLNFK